jgi:hypothetical protein
MGMKRLRDIMNHVDGILLFYLMIIAAGDMDHPYFHPTGSHHGCLKKTEAIFFTLKKKRCTS